MASDDYELTPPPQQHRARELWLQHAVGLMLFEDVGGYAAQELDSDLTPREREVATRAIEHTLYGLMMVLDGTNGPLKGSGHEVRLQFVAQLLRPEVDEEVVHSMDLGEGGDGMCAGFHGWTDGDFGEQPPAHKSSLSQPGHQRKGAGKAKRE